MWTDFVISAAIGRALFMFSSFQNEANFGTNGRELQRLVCFRLPCYDSYKIGWEMRLFGERKNGTSAFLKRKWIFAIVAVAIMLFVFFVPMFPASAYCTPLPSRVLFSTSSMITSHQFGAYYVEGTSSYNIAPPSTPPLTSLIVCA